LAVATLVATFLAGTAFGVSFLTPVFLGSGFLALTDGVFAGDFLTSFFGSGALVSAGASMLSDLSTAAFSFLA
jgi:hypothetical protein